MKQILSVVIVVLSLIGLFDASYITYEEFSGAVPVCGQGFDCGTVLQSKWSHLGPIPISAFGILFYSSVLVLGALQMLEISVKPVLQPIATALKLPNVATVSVPDLLRILTSFGFGFSLYLIFLMAVIIQAWCLYCLISATTSTLLFISSLLNARAHYDQTTL